MDDLGYGSGSGSGYGHALDYGCGSGAGFGCGYGDSYGHGLDYGYGDGAGFGCGYGDSYGFCYASGEGYGSSLDYGDGFGDGFGYGCGHGVLVATLDEHEVRAVITPWGRAARVGCQVHGLDTWRKQWREIAREHDVEVSAEEAARLIALIEAAPMGPEWLPSEEASGG